MKLKRFFAAFLAVALLIACVPMTASAGAKVPTKLFVGEKDKSEHNLIERFKRDGYVEVYEVFKNTKSYYTVTYEEDAGYVLTFYYNYEMSELVERNDNYYGLYCDGDLTIRIAGDVTFDTTEYKTRGTCGWRVDGQLTIEGTTVNGSVDKAKIKDCKVTVIGDKNLNTENDGNIGIYAQTLMLHNVEVTALGGYAAVYASDAIVMCDAILNANTDPAMKNGDKALFTYSIETKYLIQKGGKVTARGDVNIEGYDVRGGDNDFEKKVVVYRITFAFLKDTYSGYWRDTFDLFHNPSAIPACMSVSSGNAVAKISGSQLILNRRLSTVITLYIKCGRAIIELDEADVYCRIHFWQFIPYILTGPWSANSVLF
ncbi:MAG: hypothetical protein IJT44_11025 [Clostridia bacterium]|nr:hypothetical protein [Clostridia bacterium]